MAFCQKCQLIPDILIARGQDRTVVVHHDSASLQAAVTERCYICLRVWESLSEEQKSVASSSAFEGIRYNLSLSLDYSEPGSSEESSFIAELKCNHGDDLYDCDDYNEVGGWWRLEMGQFTMLNPSKFPPDEVIDLSRNTDDPACWRTVSTWIENCVSHHEDCRSVQQPGWLPKRLVDIAGYEDGLVRLVETSTLSDPSTLNGTDLRYLALSHCWGKKRFLTLDDHNYADFQAGIVLSSLAPNFRDAIRTTHRLGFRYIWVDSLCILQGSNVDWTEQAPLMNQVYRNASLTLGALASPDAYGGFFQERDPDLVQPRPITLRKRERGDDAPEETLECLLIKSDFWERDVRKAPLNLRAWVVQERLLAPRSLYFGRTQLYWECQQLSACEVFPKGVPLEFIPDIQDATALDATSVKAFRRTTSGLVDPDFAKRLWGHPINTDDLFYKKPSDVWNEILQAYIRCDLTEPHDKLVALSGVVKDFADIVGDEYCAGLWKNDLINGLLWHVGEQELTHMYFPATRPVEYRAPSWSWAAVDSPYIQPEKAYWETVDIDEHVDILEINVDPLSGMDKSASVRHACLHVRGRLIRTRNRPARRANIVDWFGQFWPDAETDNENDQRSDESFYCWPIREYLCDRKSDNMIAGLVLTACTDNERALLPSCSECTGKKAFTRVGTFRHDIGDPIRYLSMRKPRDWADWGQESDHLWFLEDDPWYEFVIL